MPRDAILDDNAHFVAVRGIVLFTSEVIGSVTGCENAADGLRSCTSSEAFRFGGGGGMCMSSVALSPLSRTGNALRNQRCTAERRKKRAEKVKQIRSVQAVSLLKTVVCRGD